MSSDSKNPTIEIKKFHICKKGQKHAEKPLNLVCLDPICVDNPLICQTCLSEHHKYHKTTKLSDFLSDYSGATRRNHKGMVTKRINTEYQNVRQSISQFRNFIFDELKKYEQKVQEYFTFLQNQLQIRNELERTLNINLESKKIIKSHSSEELQKSLSFIISHSLFNQQSRLINVSNILKCDQSRTFALIDKIVNQNLQCQTKIKQQLSKLNFVSDTLKKQASRIQSFFTEYNNNQTKMAVSNPQLKINLNTKSFLAKQTFNSTLKNTSYQNQAKISNNSQLNFQYFSLKKNQQSSENRVNDLIFVFSNIYKHEKLEITDQQNQLRIKSNVTALKPQYAIICPSVDYQPLREQNWSIKINSCRNFASSKNTIAIGLCELDEIMKQNYEQSSGQSQKGKYLLTSQGFLLKNGRQEKCDFSFQQGDIINIKYDPYYRLLVMKKENGRKISIKIKDSNNNDQGNKKLYGCVRLTYASDQVEILNHQKGNHK